MLTAITYILLASFAGLALYSFKKPGVATALVWSMIVLESVLQQGNSLLRQNQSFMNFLIAAIAVAAAGVAILRGELRGLQIPRQVWWYAILILWCLASTLWSVSPVDTTEQLKQNLPYILAFGLLAPICIFDSRQLSIALKVLIYFGGLIMVGVLLSKTGYRGILLEDIGGRNLESNPLAAASFGAYVAFAALFSIWGKKFLSLDSLIKTIIIFLSLAVVIKSGSRGQLIAFAAISMLMFPVFAKAAARRSTIIAAIAASLLTLVTVIMVDQLGWSDRWRFEALIDDQQLRFDMIRVMFQRYLDGGPMVWLIGLGSSASFKIIQSYPHNAVAECLVEEGLLGVCLLIAILFTCFRDGYRLITSKFLTRDVRVDIATILAIFSFNLILSFKEGSLLGGAISIFSSGLTLAWLHERLHIQAQSSHTALPAVRHSAMQTSTNS